MTVASANEPVASGLPSGGQRPEFWLAGTALVVSAGAVLFLFNPAEHSFFPFCPLHKLTGLNCPGCGSLRALHHLMHGRFAMAFQFNPLLVLALFYGLSCGIWRFSRQKNELLRWPRFASPFWNWLLLALIFGFGILRNVPVPVLSWFKV